MKRRNRELTANEEVLALLKNLPDQEAQGILQRLRYRVDITTILDHVAAGDLLVQMRVVPESRFRYEFPYRSAMPEDHVPDNSYLDTLIYEATSLYPIHQSSNSSASDRSTLFTDLSSDDYQNLYLKPFHAAQVVDPLLSDVRISLWIAVCDHDVLMRDLLAVFFRCEYHLTAAFQKKLFLRGHDCETTRLLFILACQRCSSLCLRTIFSNLLGAVPSNFLLSLLPGLLESCWVLEPSYGPLSLPCRSKASLGAGSR